MRCLVVGATGATGKLLVEQLVQRGHDVRAIVRSAQRLPQHLRESERVEVIETAISHAAEYVADCDAVASCLGHTLSFRGVFGKPRRLVTDAVRRLCEAITANNPAKCVRFVLMSSSGVRNHDLGEQVSTSQRAVLALLRVMVPPHADNEQAADYLRTAVGQHDSAVAWAAVRPDGLIDADEVTAYTVHESPTRSAIFNAGKTSRINVAHFMADLMTEDAPWSQWCGKMPVIYNAG